MMLTWVGHPTRTSDFHSTLRKSQDARRVVGSVEAKSLCPSAVLGRPKQSCHLSELVEHVVED